MGALAESIKEMVLQIAFQYSKLFGNAASVEIIMAL